MIMIFFILWRWLLSLLLSSSLSLSLLKMMWTAEIQILNKDMIVAVVIAIYWIGCALSGQDHKEAIYSSHRTNSAHSRANTGAIHRRTPVLFEPDEVGQWPSGLTVHESLTTVKEGDANILPVTVTSNSNNNVNLPGWVLLERLQLVRLVTPVEVKFKEPEMVAKEDESLN